MKRFLFTLMTLVALVLLANTTFAQSSPAEPWNGATESYSVGAENGDSVRFYITSDAVTFPDDIAGDSIATGTDFDWASNPIITSVSGAAADVDITWNVGGGLTTYHLWVEVIDATSLCSTFRFVPIVPQDNEWDVQIFVVAVSDTSADFNDNVTLADDEVAWELNDSTEFCAVIDPQSVNYNDTLDAGELSGLGVTENGSTWVYYRIERSNARDINYEWTIDFQLDADPVALEVSTDGTTWTTQAQGSYTNSDANNVIYYRAEYLASTTDIEIQAYVDQDGADAANPSEATSNYVDSDDTTDDVFVTINPIPVVGGFSGF